MAGINRAKVIAKSLTLESAPAGGDKPCIFLSHISIDKQSAVDIGAYIMEYGDIDIYLDIYDPALQEAVGRGDPQGITQFIERGLAKATHLMCLYSEQTVRSWWVPYEIGYGKRTGVEVSSLKLKGEVKLPAYLEITEQLLGTESLNRYLQRIRTAHLRKAFHGRTPVLEHLIEASASQHPLDHCLDWNR